MIRTVVTAVAGRMGRLVGQRVLEDAGFRLVGATENPSGPWVGRDVGEALGRPPIGVAVAASLAEALRVGAQVVIDFSHPDAARANAEACAAAGTPLLLATTGLTEGGLREVRGYADRMALLVAPNLSLGVNLLAALVAQAARTLGPGFDLEICELHHRMKRDAPSGTALMLGEVAARARGATLEAVGRSARQGQVGERPEGEIGMQALRGGDVAGEHTVYFLGDAERIELTHRATSRDVFARGALRAAGFLAHRPPGLYAMTDVLGLERQDG